MWTNFVRSKERTDYEVTRAKWLKMSIVDWDGHVRGADGNNITHRKYVDWFVTELMEIISSSQYVIEDKNKFKDEVCTFIYTLSDTGAHE